ncbi:MAG TPA: ATP-grasp domain-containing protein [Magnetospirillaceae bacterium]
MATSVHWAPTSRLALAFADAGLRVAVVAPAEHALHEMDITVASYTCVPHSGFVASVGEAIAKLQPTMVVPGDDRALRGLQTLHADATLCRDPRGVAAIIRNSLGDPTSFPIVAQKSHFNTFCKEHDLPEPDTVLVDDRETFHALIRKRGLPQVLKLDGRWGGLGVRIIRSEAEADRAFDELSAWTKWKSVARRTLEEISVKPILDHVAQRAPLLSLQRYVDGLLVNRAVYCHEGEVLAGITAAAVQLSNETGPTTVVRIIDHAEVAALTKTIVKLLNLSGFIGVDFVVEENGKPWLLELNPRPTQLCHLALSRDSDMVGAFLSTIKGTARRAVRSKVTSDVIAFYPQEAWRDPSSDYLRTAYHDVPWNQPQFIAAYARPVPGDPESWVQTIARSWPFRRIRRRRALRTIEAIDVASIAPSPSATTSRST